MRKEIDNYELIERYLSGKLSEEDKKNFESMMADSTEFAEEVRRHEQVFNLIIESSIAGIRDHITSIHEFQTARHKVRRKNIRIAAAVTIGIVMLGLLTYLLLNKKKEDNRIISPVPLPEQSFTPVTSSDTGLLPETIKSSGYSEPVIDKNIFLPGSKTLPPKTSDEYVPAVIATDSLRKLTQPGTTPDTLPQELIMGKVEDVPVQAVPDCRGTNLTAMVILEKSCSDHASGMIRIEESTLAGGTPPYEISIDNQKTYAAQYHFDRLLPVRYSIWIRDKNNCSSWLGSYLIESIDCTIEDRFAPNRGEKWEIPHQDQPYTIKIYNPGGMLVFETSSESTGSDSWDGNNNAGSALPMGIYTFIITFENGSVQTGTVTIIR